MSRVVNPRSACHDAQTPPHAAAGQCYYVLADGIGKPEGIPDRYGVIVEQGSQLIAV